MPAKKASARPFRELTGIKGISASSAMGTEPKIDHGH